LHQPPGSPIVFKRKAKPESRERTAPAAASVLSQAVMTLKLQPEENIQAASIHSKGSKQSPH